MKFSSVSPKLSMRSCEKIVGNKKGLIHFSFQKRKCIDDIYVSVNSKHYHPPFGQPPGKFFGQIPGSRASLRPLISINFTLFHHFQDLIH